VSAERQEQHRREATGLHSVWIRPHGVAQTVPEQKEGPLENDALPYMQGAEGDVL